MSRAGAGDWPTGLLPLPGAFAGGMAGGDPFEVVEGLHTTGQFSPVPCGNLAPSLGDKPLPPARQRLVDLIRGARRSTPERVDRERVMDRAFRRQGGLVGVLAPAAVNPGKVGAREGPKVCGQPVAGRGHFGRRLARMSA